MKPTTQAATRFICEWCNDNFPIEKKCQCTACPSCCICTPKKVNTHEYAYPLPFEDSVRDKGSILEQL